MQIKGFQSNLINNIGRKGGEGVVKDSRGQGRLRNVTVLNFRITFHITIKILII